MRKQWWWIVLVLGCGIKGLVDEVLPARLVKAVEAKVVPVGDGIQIC